MRVIGARARWMGWLRQRRRLQTWWFGCKAASSMVAEFAGRTRTESLWRGGICTARRSGFLVYKLSLRQRRRQVSMSNVGQHLLSGVSLCFKKSWRFELTVN